MRRGREPGELARCVEQGERAARKHVLVGHPLSASLFAAAIPALYPPFSFAARTCAFCRGFSCRMYPMYCP